MALKGDKTYQNWHLKFLGAFRLIVELKKGVFEKKIDKAKANYDMGINWLHAKIGQLTVVIMDWRSRRGALICRLGNSLARISVSRRLKKAARFIKYFVCLVRPLRNRRDGGPGIPCGPSGPAEFSGRLLAAGCRVDELVRLDYAH